MLKRQTMRCLVYFAAKEGKRHGARHGRLDQACFISAEQVWDQLRGALYYSAGGPSTLHERRAAPHAELVCYEVGAYSRAKEAQGREEDCGD